MIKHILVATDGSAKAREAVTMAAKLCRNLGGRLTILHVIMHGLRAEEASRLAEEEYLVRRVSAVTLPDLQPIPETMVNLFRASHGDLGEMVSILGDRIVEEAAESARSIVSAVSAPLDRLYFEAGWACEKVSRTIWRFAWQM
ncbi:universal stress protein, partial [Sinorhizobium meliloti]|uniref:universal stress protein n=1 Tax=Rhizobium meliloti TaxID=382 RepID=UPI001F2C5D29